MNQKYEITDIVHPQYPWLHRIRALRDVREDVHAGDLGGFVQSGDYSCARGCAVISGKSRIGGEAIIEDHAIVTSGYVHGNVHISGNAKIFANAVTGGTPVIMEKASVYGELGGEIEVHEHAVILPGVVIDNPTIDVLHIRPDEIVVERKFKRESPVITPPPEYQPHPRASKKRSRGEER